MSPSPFSPSTSPSSSILCPDEMLHLYLYLCPGLYLYLYLYLSFPSSPSSILCPEEVLHLLWGGKSWGDEEAVLLFTAHTRLIQCVVYNVKFTHKSWHICCLNVHSTQHDCTLCKVTWNRAEIVGLNMVQWSTLKFCKANLPRYFFIQVLLCICVW